MKGMMDILNELVPERATAGEMLRALRKRDGLTLEEMEQITGIRANNLSAIENNRIEMSQHYAEVFAAALSVHPMIFLYPNGKFEKTSELRKTIEKKGKSLDFPELADRVADELRGQRLSIRKAVETMHIGERAELLRWRALCGTMFARVTVDG